MSQPSQGHQASIALVSRGHGRGHAVPDMAIARELLSRAPDLEIRFISYAAGAAAYRACGYPVVDVGAPATSPFVEMVVVFTQLFGQMDREPDLIVAHEEFPALVAAEILGIPSIFITDFFVDPINVTMQVLKSASEVIFTGERGVFTQPPFLRGKVHYVGRAVRPFQYSRSDRPKARLELGIPNDATVALLQPGAWAESRVPLADLLIAGWRLLPASPKRMIWLAGDDFANLKSRFADEPDVILLQEDWNIDRLMAASDLLITKANRLTVFEAAAMGLPSISISTLANWPDDVAVAEVQSNLSFFADELTPQLLASAIQRAVDTTPAPASDVSHGVHGAAARILQFLERTPIDVAQSTSE